MAWTRARLPGFRRRWRGSVVGTLLRYKKTTPLHQIVTLELQTYSQFYLSACNLLQNLPRRTDKRCKALPEVVVEEIAATPGGVKNVRAQGTAPTVPPKRSDPALPTGVRSHRQVPGATQARTVNDTDRNSSTNGTDRRSRMLRAFRSSFWSPPVQSASAAQKEKRGPSRAR